MHTLKAINPAHRGTSALAVVSCIALVLVAVGWLVCHGAWPEISSVPCQPVEVVARCVGE